MTVSSQTSRNQQAGNGVTVDFTVPFRILDPTHIRILLTTAAGVTTEQALTTQFTVESYGGASTWVKFVIPPPNLSTLTFLRNVPLTQETDYVPNDPFPAESHEAALDKLTMICQQVDEAMDRALVLPEEVSGVTSELPAPSAGKLLGWKTPATGLQNYDPAELAGGGVITNANAVNFTHDATGAVQRTLEGVLRGDRLHILDIIPVALHAAIRNYTSTDDVTAYLQGAINYLGGVGGGTLFLGRGLFNISAKLDIPFNNVTIVGEGCGHYTGDGIEVTRATGATRITWIGAAPAAGVPMVEFRTPSNGRRYGRGGMRDVMIDGKMVARIGLALTSFSYAAFYQVHVYAVTEDCYLFRQADYDLVGGAGATQFNQFYNCAATTYGGSGLYLTNTANGFRFTGPKWGAGGVNAVQTGDASCNVLYSPLCNLAVGTSIIFEGVGQNQIFSLQCASWNSAAADVIFGSTDQDSNWPPSGGVAHAKSSAARYNAIYWCECQIRAKASVSTNGVPSFGNLVVGLSHGNAAPVPTLEPPGAGTLHPEILYQSMGNFTGDPSRTALGGFVEIVAQDNSATINPALFLKKGSDVGANGDGLGKIQWRMTNAAGTKDVDAGRINATITSAVAGAETARLAITPMYNGAETDVAMAWQNGVIVQDTAGPTLAFQGFGTVNVNGSYWVDNVKVLGNRATGWGAPTGTATRATFNTGTVTLAQLAERVKALIDDFMGHGAIGT